MNVQNLVDFGVGNSQIRPAHTVPRSLPVPAGSYFLAGAHGCGKTRWLSDTIPSALYFDLCEPALHRSLSADPVRFIQKTRAAPPGSTVVVDELQRLPSLQLAVNGLLRKRPDLRVIVTASCLRGLRTSGISLDFPQACHGELLPLTAAELGDSFDFQRSLTVGTLPGAFNSADPYRYLHNLLDSVFRDEVQSQGLTRNIGDFYRFLEVLTFANGTIINLCSLSREAKIHRKVGENYLSILEDLFLAYRLPSFRFPDKREVFAHPKLFFSDAGILAALRPGDRIDHRHKIADSVVRGLVALHIRAFISYFSPQSRLYYWRTVCGLNVDFVLDSPSTLTAITVKIRGQIRFQDFLGLIAFAEDFPNADLVLLHQGSFKSRALGVRCIPIADFLERTGDHLRRDFRDWR